MRKNNLLYLVCTKKYRTVVQYCKIRKFPLYYIIFKYFGHPTGRVISQTTNWPTLLDVSYHKLQVGPPYWTCHITNYKLAHPTGRVITPFRVLKSSFKMLAGKELIACGKFIATLSVFTVHPRPGTNIFSRKCLQKFIVSILILFTKHPSTGTGIFSQNVRKTNCCTHAYESQYNLDGTSIYNIIHIRYVLT